MKSKQYKKERELGTIRIGDVIFTVTGEQYADYYAELERRKYIKRLERGKKISYEKAIEDEMPLELLASNPPITVEEEAETNILIEIMLAAIGNLNESDKTLIKLLYFNEMTTREAAQLIGVDQSTIVRRKAIILKRIKKIMRF